MAKQLKWKWVDVSNLMESYVGEEKLKKSIYTQLNRFKSLYVDLDANKANFSLDQKYFEVWKRDQRNIFEYCIQKDIKDYDTKVVIKNGQIAEEVSTEIPGAYRDDELWEGYLSGEEKITATKLTPEVLAQWLEICIARLEFCLQNSDYARVLLKCCFFE